MLVSSARSSVRLVGSRGTASTWADAPNVSGSVDGEVFAVTSSLVTLGAGIGSAAAAAAAGSAASKMLS